MAETNSNSKRVAKNTLVLYLRMFVMMLLGLFVSRITLQALGVDNYGIYNAVGGIVVILGFLNNAMAGATQRYINVALGKSDQEQLNSIISNALMIHFGIALACFLLAETIGLWFLNTHMVIPEGRMGAANWVYQFSVFSFLLGIMTVPYIASIVAHEKMSAFAWITIVDVIMKLIIVFSLLYINLDKLKLYSVLLFVNSNITRYIYLLYCKRHFEECNIKSWKIDRPLIKSMLSFSSWTIVGNLGYIAHTQGIAIIINLFFGVAVNAAQGISNQVNGIVKQFVTNFLVAFNPQVVKTYAAGELIEMHKLVLRGSKVALLMVAILVVPLIIEAPNILYLWLGIVPNYAVIFVRLVLLLTFFDAYSSLLASAMGATGKIKIYQVVLTSIGLFHLPLTWLCYELGWEPYWAQIVYLFIIIILQIVRTWFVCNAIKLSQSLFYREVVFRSYIAIGLSIIIPLFLHINMENGIITTIVVCIVSFVLCSIFSVYIGLNHNERIATIGVIKRKLKIK